MIVRNCLVCDKEFGTYPSKVKIGRGKYCSKKCCLSVTNGALEENGKATRYAKGTKPWNTKGWTHTRSRKGGRKYILIHQPEHPFSSKRGYVRKHRLVMEEHIGRPVEKHEIVHHKNGDTLDNRIENLELMTRVEHCRLHVKDNVHRRWEERKTPLVHAECVDNNRQSECHLGTD